MGCFTVHSLPLSSVEIRSVEMTSDEVRWEINAVLCCREATVFRLCTSTLYRPSFSHRRPLFTDCWIFTAVSSAHIRFWFLVFFLYLARSANLPEGLYILLALISFVFFSGQIFAIFAPNDRYLLVDDRPGPLFLIPQGTLPWQPIY